jgi:hypothetical protein
MEVQIYGVFSSAFKALPLGLILPRLLNGPSWRVPVCLSESDTLPDPRCSASGQLLGTLVIGSAKLNAPSALFKHSH